MTVDDHFLALDQILVVDAVGCGGDLGHAWGREHLVDLVELFAHHRIELCPVAEDVEQFGNRRGQFLQLAGDLVATERGQAVEAKLEDRLHLGFAERVVGAGGMGFDRLDELDVGADLLAGPGAGEQGGARRRGGWPTRG